MYHFLKYIVIVYIVITQAYGASHHWNHPFDDRISSSINEWINKKIATRKSCVAVIEVMFIRILSFKGWDKHDDMAHNWINYPNGHKYKDFLEFTEINSDKFKEVILQKSQENSPKNRYGDNNFKREVIEEEANKLFESFFSGENSRSLNESSIF